jgi:patatin-like phospholipase/acyl hydrolase
MVYRILSLDGGGAWALIETRALIELYDENTTGHEVLSDFNLAAANSGGSIVLAGLIENLKLSQILSYFEDQAKRKSIFSPTTSFGDRVLEGVTGLGPKYSAENKLQALQRLMPSRGNGPLTQAVVGVRRPGSTEDVRILITGFDYDRNKAAFFRSKAAKAPQWGNGDTSAVTVAEAVHASTNAPVNYFDAPAYVDAP